LREHRSTAIHLAAGCYLRFGLRCYRHEILATASHYTGRGTIGVEYADLDKPDGACVEILG